MKKLVVLLAALVTFSSFSLAGNAEVQAVKTPVKMTSTKITQPERQPINLNTAGAKEIADALTGVGLKKAEAIVAYRNKNGKFTKIEELAGVKGIGVATIAKNESRIVLK